jgi:hypothetical protein
MKIRYTTDINSTPESVFYWLATPERAMVWQTSVSRTEILQETPDVIGTTFRETIEENGQSTELYGEVRDYEKNRSIVMHLSGKFNVVDEEWRLDKIGERTRLTVKSKIRFRSYIGLLSFLMRPVFKKRILEQLSREVTRLKELAEQNTPGDG